MFSNAATFSCFKRQENPWMCKNMFLLLSVHPFHCFLGSLFHPHTDLGVWQSSPTRISAQPNVQPHKQYYTDLRTTLTPCLVMDSLPKILLTSPAGLFGLSCFLLRAKHKLRKGDCSLWEVRTWHNALCYVMRERTSPPWVKRWVWRIVLQKGLCHQHT